MGVWGRKVPSRECALRTTRFRAEPQPWYRSKLRFVTLATTCLLLPLTATAQLSPAAKISQVAANQLGILEYCHDHGQAGADAVAAEREAFLRAPSTNLSTVHAEELGRSGFSVTPDAAQITVAELATQLKTTMPALCQDLAQSALEFQAAIHKHTARPAAEGGALP